MRIERSTNYFCRGEIEVHKAMQRQTEREIKRMRRWAREDAEQNDIANNIDGQAIARGVLSDIFGNINCNTVNINTINIIMHK